MKTRSDGAWVRSLVAGLALSAVSLAQAGQFIFDQDGFTVSIQGSSDAWNNVDAQSYDTIAVNDEGPDGALPGTGLLRAHATYVASLTSGFELGAIPGAGTAQAFHGISYTVQAKPGWQIASVSLSGFVSGSYSEANGGTVATDGVSNVRFASGVQAGPGTLLDRTGGLYLVSLDQQVFGNHETTGLLTRHDAHGNPLDTITVHGIGTDYAPLTSVTGEVGAQLGVTSNDPLQSAFVDSFGGYIRLNVVGLAPLSPVPEPAPYAMLGACLGLIGVVARRRVKP